MCVVYVCVCVERERERETQVPHLNITLKIHHVPEGNLIEISGETGLISFLPYELIVSSSVL